MTKIVLIAGTYQPQQCGVAHYTSHLRSKLSHHGITAIVLTTLAAAQRVNEPDVQGVVRSWRITDLWLLVRAIHQTQADLLHIQHAAGTYEFERAIFLLPLLLRLTGWRVPIVTTVHEYGWWEWQPAWFPHPLLERLKLWGQHRGWWDREDGFLLTQSDAIITSNQQAAHVIQARLLGMRSPVYQIPIGANVAVAPITQTHARQQLRHDCGWSEDALVVVFFGFLHPVKGLETLLSAFQQVLARQPRSRLLLLGGVESLALPGQAATGYWEKLQTAIAHLGLDQSVHMTGYVSEEKASRYLSGADLGVLPFNHGVTLKSGSLLALMAHALPVIATRAELVDMELLDDTLVRLVPPRDVAQLTLAMHQLLDDVSLRHQLGQAGKQFSQRFDWANIANAHMNIYQAVLARQSSITSGQTA